MSIMFKEKSIAATEFKAKCLAILDDLDPNIVVTKPGGRSPRFCRSNLTAMSDSAAP
jgi:hypothetical protein